jgi:hypothetical protein
MGIKQKLRETIPMLRRSSPRPNQLSEHGISFHQPMAPIKSLFGFRVARVVMSE